MPDNTLAGAIAAAQNVPFVGPKQKKIEAAVLDWLTANGWAPAETTRAQTIDAVVEHQMGTQKEVIIDELGKARAEGEKVGVRRAAQIAGDFDELQAILAKRPVGRDISRAILEAIGEARPEIRIQLLHTSEIRVEDAAEKFVNVIHQEAPGYAEVRAYFDRILLDLVITFKEEVPDDKLQPLILLAGRFSSIRIDGDTGAEGATFEAATRLWDR